MKRAGLALPGQLPYLNYYIREYLAMRFHQTVKVNFQSATLAGDYECLLLVVAACLFDQAIQGGNKQPFRQKLLKTSLVMLTTSTRKCESDIFMAAFGENQRTDLLILSSHLKARKAAFSAVDAPLWQTELLDTLQPIWHKLKNESEWNASSLKRSAPACESAPFRRIPI